MTPGLLRTGTLALLLILTMTLLITISSVAAGEGILPVFTPVPVYVGIFPVNTVDDSNDGECDAGHCSLREAIHRANTLSGSPKITFDIPGPGPHVIELWGELPPLVSPGTTIDGFSEPDYIDTPVIVLWTESGFATPIGLEIAADNITVRGLSIVGFRDPGAIRSAGIEVSSGSGSLITHNYIGIDPSGAADGNLVGIYLRAEGQEIWSNVISGNETGIHISQGDQDIADNRIGTNPQGDASSPELHNVYGILITQSADGVIVGGLNPMYANVISGNKTGIKVGSNNNLIRGNRIGTNRSGDAALPNEIGVSIDGDNNNVGGIFPNRSNLISGNTTCGVKLGENADGNKILGNKIGTDLSGTAPLPNEVGILTLGGSNNEIGRDHLSAGNMIAFNTLYGIVISSDAESHHIAGNTITQNGINGVSIYYDALRITLNRNSIFNNSDLGVDLGTFGVTPNDPGDGDTGPNTLLNFPSFSDATTTYAAGTGCSWCRVEVFIADGDPSGHGEGMTFIGEDIAGVEPHFIAPLDADLVSACTLITAMATDELGNSSEFARNIRVRPCYVFPFLIWIVFPLLLGVLGAAGGGLLGGQRGVFTVGPAAAGAAAGVVAGIGLIALSSTLPFVHMEPPDFLHMEPPDMEPLSAPLPLCDLILDPSSFHPEDGAILPVQEDPILEWGWSQELPEGQIRWRVDLLGPDGVERSQTTTEASLPLSAFEAIPEPGGFYAWRVTGERAESAGADFQPFCSPSMWRYFILGAPPPEGPPPPTSEPPPEPTQTPTPSPTPGACLYQALQNSNCRASDYQESAQIAVLMQGETAELLALNPEHTHGVFELPSMQQCWIWLGLMDGPENPLDTCGVPVTDPPAPPTATPTPACQPDLDQAACEASGGTWSSGTMGPPMCVCPG